MVVIEFEFFLLCDLEVGFKVVPHGDIAAGVVVFQNEPLIFLFILFHFLCGVNKLDCSIFPVIVTVIWKALVWTPSITRINKLVRSQTRHLHLLPRRTSWWDFT